MTRRKLILAVSLTLVAMISAHSGQVRQPDVINYDDNDYVTANAWVQGGWTAEGASWAFNTRLHGHWHPLTWLSHMTDCRLFGLDSRAHHVVNLIFHAASTLLLFWVLLRMSRDLWPAALTAALFAVHPLSVESVAWVAERKNVLSAFFWMLSMWMYVAYVRRPGLLKYLLVLLTYSLGLMSKLTTAPLPLVLFLIDYWPLGRWAHRSREGPGSPVKGAVSAGRLVLEKVPMLAMAAAVAFLTLSPGEAGSEKVIAASNSWGKGITHILVACISYLGKAVWPAKLAIPYAPPETAPLWQAVGAGIILAAISLLALRTLSSLPCLAVGWFWFLATLVPVLVFVRTGPHAKADRYMYVPLIGLAIMAAWGLPRLLPSRRRRIPVVLVVGVPVAACIALSHSQTTYWRDSTTLFEHTLSVDPRNPVALTSLGAALAEQGKYREAVPYYQESLRLSPGAADTHNNLGLALAQQGRHQEALPFYREAVRIRPAYVEALGNLGLSLTKLGESTEAVRYYTEALRFDPRALKVRNNLGIALAEQGRLAEAADQFREILRWKPDYAEVHSNLAGTLMKQGELDQAVSHYTTALRWRPDLLDLHYFLALVYLEKGDQTGARREYEVLRQADPALAHQLRARIEPREGD